MKKKLTVILLAAVFAMALVLSAPQVVQAAKSTSIYTSENVSKVKTSDKALKIYGASYTSSGDLKPKGWTKYKLNSKTKYKQLENPETGEMKSIKKKTALKKLKKKSFITVYITFNPETKGVKEILFAV